LGPFADERVRAAVVPVPLRFRAALVIPLVMLVAPVVAFHFLVAAMPLAVPVIIVAAPLLPSVPSVVSIVAVLVGVLVDTAGLKSGCGGNSANEGKGSEESLDEHVEGF